MPIALVVLPLHSWRRWLVALTFGLGLLPSGGARAQVITTAGPDSTLVSTAADTTLRRPKVKGLTGPGKAALWGLIPGGGQIYNHDYWKVPIVYAALGTVVYAMYWNQDRYIRFGRAYRKRTDPDTLTIDDDALTKPYQTSSLLTGKAFYRRNRDFNAILALGVYGLSIMEALVDAHLSTFTVSDDLSLRVDPASLPTADRRVRAPGVALTFTLR